MRSMAVRKLTRTMLVVVWMTTLAGWGATWSEAPNPRVTLTRVPEGGIQPQVVMDSKGVLHLI
jgi:hypothetical protein